MMPEMPSWAAAAAALMAPWYRSYSVADSVLLQDLHRNE